MEIVEVGGTASPSKPTATIAARLALLSRPPLERFHRIVVELIERRLTRAQLALKMEVSTKTLDRDLAFMRERLSIPIVSTYAGVELVAPVCCCAICARDTSGKTAPKYAPSNLSPPNMTKIEWEASQKPKAVQISRVNAPATHREAGGSSNLVPGSVEAARAALGIAPGKRLIIRLNA